MAVERYRIRCVQRTDRKCVWELIKSIGGYNADGTRWRLRVEDAIAGIEAGTWTFFVHRPVGEPVDVVVVDGPWGNKYLKTTADGEEPAILLLLPECD